VTAPVQSSEFVVRRGAVPKDYENKYAIVVGIDNYDHQGDLRFAANDAKEMSSTLKDLFGFTTIVSDFESKRCSDTAFIELFEQLKEMHNPSKNDLVLLFFAGHSVRTSTSGFLLMSNSESKIGDAYGNAISNASIRELMDTFPCRHKLIILDSCYSGSLYRESNQPDDQEASAIGAHDFSTSYLIPNAYWGFFAARDTPASDGFDDQLNSIFTSTLIDVMRNRAGSQREDQAFTFRQLASRVETLVRERGDSTQVPTYFRLEPSTGDIVFVPESLALTNAIRTQRQHYQISIRQIESLIDGGHLKDAIELLNCLRPRRGTKDQRGVEWYYLWQKAHPATLTLLGHGSKVIFVELQQETNIIRVEYEDGFEREWNAINGELLSQSFNKLRENVSGNLNARDSEEKQEAVGSGNEEAVLSPPTISEILMPPGEHESKVETRSIDENLTRPPVFNSKGTWQERIFEEVLEKADTRRKEREKLHYQKFGLYGVDQTSESQLGKHTAVVSLAPTGGRLVIPLPPIENFESPDLEIASDSQPRPTSKPTLSLFVMSKSAGDLAPKFVLADSSELDFRPTKITWSSDDRFLLLNDARGGMLLFSLVEKEGSIELSKHTSIPLLDESIVTTYVTNKGTVLLGCENGNAHCFFPKSILRERKLAQFKPDWSIVLNESKQITELNGQPISRILYLEEKEGFSVEEIKHFQFVVREDYLFQLHDESGKLEIRVWEIVEGICKPIKNHTLEEPKFHQVNWLDEPSERGLSQPAFIDGTNKVAFVDEFQMGLLWVVDAITGKSEPVQLGFHDSVDIELYRRRRPFFLNSRILCLPGVLPRLVFLAGEKPEFFDLPAPPIRFCDGDSVLLHQPSDIGLGNQSRFSRFPRSKPNLMLFDFENRKIRWSARTFDEIYETVLMNERVLVIGSGKGIASYDIRNGTQIASKAIVKSGTLSHSGYDNSIRFLGGTIDAFTLDTLLDDVAEVNLDDFQSESQKILELGNRSSKLQGAYALLLLNNPNDLSRQEVRSLIPNRMNRDEEIAFLFSLRKSVSKETFAMLPSPKRIMADKDLAAAFFSSFPDILTSPDLTNVQVNKYFDQFLSSFKLNPNDDGRTFSCLLLFLRSGYGIPRFLEFLGNSPNDGDLWESSFSLISEAFIAQALFDHVQFDDGAMMFTAAYGFDQYTEQEWKQLVLGLPNCISKSKSLQLKYQLLNFVTLLPHQHSQKIFYRLIRKGEVIGGIRLALATRYHKIRIKEVKEVPDTTIALFSNAICRQVPKVDEHSFKPLFSFRSRRGINLIPDRIQMSGRGFDGELEDNILYLAEKNGALMMLHFLDPALQEKVLAGVRGSSDLGACKSAIVLATQLLKDEDESNVLKEFFEGMTKKRRFDLQDAFAIDFALLKMHLLGIDAEEFPAVDTLFHRLEQEKNYLDLFINLVDEESLIRAVKK